MFYDQFAELCTEKGITANKVLVDCGISRTSVAKWKKGATPNGTTIQKHSDYFGVTTDYLLGTETEKPPTPEGRREVPKEELMAAFWGGDKDLSQEELDAMWTDVERFAAFVAEQKRRERGKNT